MSITGRAAGPDRHRLTAQKCLAKAWPGWLVAEQSRVGSDPQIRRTTAVIARDEERHAELAWRTVRFAIERGGAEVREAVSSAFTAALADVEAAMRAPASTPQASYWNAHGRLTGAQRRATARAAIEEIVRTCAAAVLGSKVGAAWCQSTRVPPSTRRADSGSKRRLDDFFDLTLRSCRRMGVLSSGGPQPL